MPSLAVLSEEATGELLDAMVADVDETHERIVPVAAARIAELVQSAMHPEALVAAAAWDKRDADEVFDSEWLTVQLDDFFGQSQVALDDAVTRHLMAAPPGDYDTTGMARLVSQGYRDDVQEILYESWQAGYPSDVVADALASVGVGNAEMVARTAIGGMRNASSMAGAQFAGCETKQWITAGDERVRESHEELDEQLCAINGVFANGCRFPGDPAADISETANCRCTLVYPPPIGGASANIQQGELGQLAPGGEPAQSPEWDAEFHPDPEGIAAAEDYDSAYYELSKQDPNQILADLQTSIEELEAEKEGAEAAGQKLNPASAKQLKKLTAQANAIEADLETLAMEFESKVEAMENGFDPAAKLKAESQARLLERLQEDERWGVFDHQLLRADSARLAEIAEERDLPWFEGALDPVTLKPFPIDDEHRMMQDMIQSWARSSSDHNLMSLRLQAAAAEEFGLPLNVSFEKLVAEANRGFKPGSQIFREGESLGIWDEVPTEVRQALRAFVRAQYELTQDLFAEAGVTHVELYRGLALPRYPVEFGIDRQAGIFTGESSIVSNPLSSWSTDARTAHSFGIGAAEEDFPYSYVMSAKVPVSRILSGPTTGFGCNNEWEFVLLGGEDTVTFHEPIHFENQVNKGLPPAEEYLAQDDFYLEDFNPAEPPPPPEEGALP